MCRRYALCLVAFVTLTLVPRAAVSGPLAVWGTAPLANTPGDFTSLAAGGASQTLAIRADGTLYLSGGDTGLIPAIPATLKGLPFMAVGVGATTRWQSALTAASSPGALSQPGMARPRRDSLSP